MRRGVAASEIIHPFLNGGFVLGGQGLVVLGSGGQGAEEGVGSGAAFREEPLDGGQLDVGELVDQTLDSVSGLHDLHPVGVRQSGVPIRWFGTEPAKVIAYHPGVRA